MRKLLLGAAVAIAFTAPAFAFEVTMTTYVNGGNGEPQQDCDHVDFTAKPPFCDKYVPMTVGRLFAGLLDKPEANLKSSDIVERGMLAARIRKAITFPFENKGAVDLSLRDAEIIKEVLLKAAQNPSGGVTTSQFASLDALCAPAKN